MSDTGLRNILDWAVGEVGVPGIVVHVKDGDRHEFTTAGVSDLTTGVPRREGEYLQVGSGGKAFIAAVILSLEAEGAIGLDDPVNRWLPGVFDVNGYDGDRITVRHLLQNTGGLYATGLAPELTDRYATREMFARHRYDTYTREDLLAIAVSQPPVHEPGERFLYANGGFYAAETIIERITGNTFAEEVARRVLEPLGLDHTYVRATGEAGYRDPHPRLYSKLFYKDGTDSGQVTGENWASMLEDPALPPFDVTEFETTWTPGNIVSTTGDMLRFVGALSTGSLLGPEQHRQMWTTVTTEGSNWLPHTRYGLGLIEFDPAATGGLTLRGVGGSYWGCMFFIATTADGERSVAVQTNTEMREWEVVSRIYEHEFGFTFKS